MSCAETTQLEDIARDTFLCAYGDYKIDDVIHEYYLSGDEQFYLKHYSEVEEGTIDAIFEWLLERDYEYTVKNPISATRYFAEEFYAKYS